MNEFKLTVPDLYQILKKNGDKILKEKKVLWDDH